MLGLQPEQLTPLVKVDAPLRDLRGPYASRWPVLLHVSGFPAIRAGAADNIGSGCIGHERIVLTMGTTGAVRVVHDVQRMLPGLWCYRVDRQHAVPARSDDFVRVVLPDITISNGLEWSPDGRRVL